MRIFNDAIENSMGVSSLVGGVFVGTAYSNYTPPSNGLIVQGNVGIGVSNPTQSLEILGNTVVYGILTASFSGFGTLITNLNASNLAFGTVPPAVVAGEYSGITSVGTLSQLTVLDTYFNAKVYDINDSSGLPGNVLSSTGSGIAWSSLTQLGLVTGSGSATQVAYWNSANQIVGANLFVVNGVGSVGIGTDNPTQRLHLSGGARITGPLYDSNNLSGSRIGIVTQYLASTGLGVTWAAFKRSIVTQLMTAYTPTSSGIDPGVFIVPQDPSDGLTTMNFAFSRVNVRVETPSSGISTINVVKYIGAGNPSGLQTAILSSNITLAGVSNYEGFSTSFAVGFATCASSDKLSVNFVGYSTSHTNFTVEIIMREV